jgi:hypothetical protein
MSKSYRIRTQPGVDKSVKVLIDQEFDYLEILSLKILQSDIYTRQCADYGVIVGRVSVNNGFGIPNAKVSVFIPIDSEDQSNPIISELYPYKSLSDVNDDGYRYNLLPYVKSYSAHVPTGTFFTRKDVLTDPTLIQVYDKYYKYNATTNDSGDYMIFGVPVGAHTVVLDVDLSDIGEFSLSPQDLIRMGIATEAQVSGTNFKSSNNLRELPQIVTVNRSIEVEPLWGQPEICNLGITRTDFDLSGEANVEIRPTSIFMGSIISSPNSSAVSTGCRPPSRSGHLCDLTTGPGEILAIRQTIQQDSNGRPILENFSLEGGGKVIDENGTWLIDVPMNLDYYITNEFGEQVLSNDPEKGIPTKGKYRFKVKWSQSPSLSETTRRGYFLVPNLREYSSPNGDESYAFSVDWNDYASVGDANFNKIIQDTINCEDKFYLMQYNKVYTVSQFISAMRRGSGFERYVGIKNILDETCSGLNNRFPTNDGNFRFDILYIIFMFFSIILTPIFFAILLVMHILYFVIWVLRTILLPALGVYYFILGVQTAVGAFAVGFGATFSWGLALAAITYFALAIFIGLIVVLLFKIKLQGIKVPILTYPECELCPCSPDSSIDENIGEEVGAPAANIPGNKAIPCSSIKSNTDITSVSLPDGLLRLFNLGTFEVPVSGPSTPNGFSAARAQIYAQELTGVVYDLQYASNNIGAPYFVFNGKGLTPDDEADDRWIYTTSIPMADRVNLFNVKAKYFNGTSTTPNPNNSNPGGGVNIIEVNFQPNQPTIKHYDNTIVVLCDKSSLSKLPAGQLIGFQNPTLSKDINLTGGIMNVYGNNAITGVTSTGSTSITVSYANPNGSGNITKVYPSVDITATTTNNFHKFPTDIEYFQVITAMTYNQFSGMCDSSNSLGDDSLNNRYLKNIMVMGQSSYEGDFKPSRNLIFTPIELIQDYEDICVLILNRGVDPYTPKVPISYGLGRLFGYTNFNGVQITGFYHMNIPIQGSYKNISHSSSDLVGGSNISTDSYTGQKLYFNSFSYKPQIQTILGELTGYTGGLPYVYTGVTNSGYSGFNSNLISYYSSMDNRSPSNFIANCGGQVENVIPLDIRVVNTNSTYGLNVSNQNKFSMRVYPFLLTASIGSDYVNVIIPAFPYSVNTGNNQGYFPNEIIEGGPVMYTNILDSSQFDNYYFDGMMTGPYYNVSSTSSAYSISSNYYTPIYNTTGNTLNFTLGISGNQVVMRGDRLPTSTNVEEYCCNGMVLQKNNNFQIYLIPEDGVLNISSSPGSTSSTGSGDLEYVYADLVGSTGITKVFESFTCAGSVNFKCYSCGPTVPGGRNSTIMINDGGCRECVGKTIFEYGCYKFVTTIFLSLGCDIENMFEWVARNMVMLGACRNVFSHRFVNNWVNGVLYAFPIKTEIKEYTSPTSATPNQPIVSYCSDAVTFHNQTRNFYYRATPYDLDTNEFKVHDNSKASGENNNLCYPTTIMDLGPRADFLQELVMSDEYDGYVVNRLDSSSYGTVDDILNLFIVSRFINQSFLEKLLGGANILAYFSNSRKEHGIGGTNYMIDADYAQLISINSELGVAPFLPGNYPDNPDPMEQNPIFFDCDNVMGIFFSSDTQVRDYISPKRTIINPSATTLSSCAFNNFPIFSQRVPLSQWENATDPTNWGGNDSIFGRQFNNWDFAYTGSVFSHRYQSLDRLEPDSRYMRTNGTFQTQYQKGYIYAIKSGDTISASPQYWQPNNPKPKLITVGGPFHFYFGLRRGASAFDRFRTKWINTSNVIN